MLRGREPLNRKRAVRELVQLPCDGHDDPWNRRIDADQMLAVAPIELLDDVDLRRRESLAQLRRCLCQRL